MSDETNISDIVNNLLDGIHTISKSETIIGEPQRAGDATVIPVHRLKVVFGAGSGSMGAHGRRVGGDSGLHGAGGAVELDPVAAIAVGKDGTAHVMAVEADSGNTWAALVQEVPDLRAKFAHTLGDRVTYELETRGMTKGLHVGEPSAEALPAKPSSTDRK
jgi:uncharacterized spore protein YtfJ